jgi:hypothetical protein
MEGRRKEELEGGECGGALTSGQPVCVHQKLLMQAFCGWDTSYLFPVIQRVSHARAGDEGGSLLEIILGAFSDGKTHNLSLDVFEEV